ncbi:allantoinase, partial [[Kitasatospora] papulosa]
MPGVDVKLVLRSTRVVTPEGVRAAAVSVVGGEIEAVLPYEAEVPVGARLVDVGGDVVMPG